MVEQGYIAMNRCLKILSFVGDRSCAVSTAESGALVSRYVSGCAPILLEITLVLTEDWVIRKEGLVSSDHRLIWLKQCMKLFSTSITRTAVDVIKGPRHFWGLRTFRSIYLYLDAFKLRDWWDTAATQKVCGIRKAGCHSPAAFTQFLLS